jgi:hypothetical protein
VVSRFLVGIFTGWTRRRAANVGTLILALANGIISYDALSGAARDAGLQAPFSLLFPLATDGIIGVATPAQLLLRDRNAPWWARAQIGFMLWAAIVFSVVGNASRASQVWSGITVYGIPLPTWHAVWLALPPLAYAGALHVLGLVHRYPVPGDQVADADATRLQEELAESESALSEARAEVSSLVRSLAEARTEAPAEERARLEPSARAPKAESATPPSARTGRAKSAPSPDGAPKRLPAGARHEQVRALLAEPGGRALTGDEIADSLGIDAGYARRLRAEVTGAEGAPPLALVGAVAVDEGAHRPRHETTDTTAGPMPAAQQEA